MGGESWAMREIQFRGFIRITIQINMFVRRSVTTSPRRLINSYLTPELQLLQIVPRAATLRFPPIPPQTHTLFGRRYGIYI